MFPFLLFPPHRHVFPSFAPPFSQRGPLPRGGLRPTPPGAPRLPRGHGGAAEPAAGGGAAGGEVVGASATSFILGGIGGYLKGLLLYDPYHYVISLLSGV